MTALSLESFAAGRWVRPGPDARSIASAVTGEDIARAIQGKRAKYPVNKPTRKRGG